MTEENQKLVFFGNERLATGVTTEAPVLRALLDAGFEVAALVIAQADFGPSRKGRAPEIVTVAEEHKIPVLTPAQPMDVLDDLKALGAQAGILVAYGRILPKSVIEVFPAGIINLHPSLLPKHRGPTPIEHTILNGEAQTGVSLMALSEVMDAGPVYAQQTMVLLGDETKQGLADALGLMGAHLLVMHLPAILEGSLRPEPQDEQLATQDKRFEKSDSQLNFNLPANMLVRQIKAYLGWPRSRTQIQGIDVIITQAHADIGAGKPGSLCIDDGLLGIYTASGLLLIDKLIPVGKPEMSASAFLAGYKPSL